MAIALYWGANGLARTLPFWAPPLIPLVACAYAMICYSTIKPFREALQNLGVRGLAALEGVRLIAGIEVLWALANGRLPIDFALPTGIGTILFGGVFVYIAVVWRDASSTNLSRAVLIGFTILAIIQALSIIACVVYIVLIGRGADFQHFPDLPLNLLPSFAVPLEIFVSIVMIHVLSKIGSSHLSKNQE